MAGRSCTTAAKISRDRSIPLAESSGSSSPRRLAEIRRHPQIFPTSLNFQTSVRVHAADHVVNALRQYVNASGRLHLLPEQSLALALPALRELDLDADVRSRA